MEKEIHQHAIGLIARLLRERFGASSEKLRGEIEQLELLLGESEEQVAEAMPPEPEEPVATPETETQRRKPVRKPLPATLVKKLVKTRIAELAAKSGW